MPDGRGGVRPVEFWHRETLSSTSWTVYQDVEVDASIEPEADYYAVVNHPMRPSGFRC